MNDDGFICKPPGPESMKVIQRDHEIMSPSFTREYDFVLDRADDVWMWDVDGRKYLDLGAGIAVSSVGHSNPKIIEAVREQAPKGIHSAFIDFYSPLPVEFGELLMEFLPDDFGKMFLSNSGTEAVECAHKLAKWHHRREYVHSFKNNFNGRTLGSLTLTNTTKTVQREGFEPFLPAKHTPFHNPYRGPEVNECLEKLKKAIKPGDVSAVFLEPIQGEGGYVIPSEEFIRGVRELCDEHDTLLVSDEVQAGCFRTGTFMAISGFGVEPDIACFAKALCGGVPGAATVAKEGLMEWPPGAHASTFGGNFLAMAAGIASLNFMRDQKLGENAERVGKHTLKRLEKLKNEYEIIGDVRGRGLMIGIELVKDRDTKEPARHAQHAILCDAAGKGLIMLPAGESVIRLCPPLTITKEDMDYGLDILQSCFEDLASSKERFKLEK